MKKKIAYFTDWMTGNLPGGKAAKLDRLRGAGRTFRRSNVLHSRRQAEALAIGGKR